MILRGAIRCLLDWLFYLLIGVLLAMLCVELGNIVGRPMGLPIQGSVELTSYLGAIFVALSIFYTTLRHSNVVVGLITSRLAGRARAVVEAWACVVGMATVLLLAWAAGISARKMYLAGEKSLMLSLSIPVIRYIFMFGLLLIAVVLAVDLCRALAKAVKK